MSAPKYRWIFQPDTIDEREVFPVNSHTLSGGGVEFQDTGEVRINREIGDVLIVCSHDRAFFNILKAAYNDGGCVQYSMRVDKFCKNVWTEIYSGQFTVDSCVWDFERCRVTIKPKQVNENDCILDKGGREYNMFSLVPVADRISTRIPDFAYDGATSGLQFTTTQTTGSTPGAQPDDGYTVIFTQQIDVGTNTWIHLWGRQIRIVECGSNIPSSYIEVTGCGVLENVALYTVNNTVETYNIAQTVYTFAIDTAPGNDPIFISEGFDIGTDSFNIYVYAQTSLQGHYIYNGILLFDLISELVLKACPSVEISSLLLNSSTYEYITGGYNHWKSIVAYDVSDVKYPNATERATRNIVNLSKILKDLRDSFQIYWSVIDGVFILEHISYWKNYYQATINLSYIKGYNVVTFDKTKSYRRHEFKWLAQRHIESAGIPIAYESECVGEDVEKVISNFITDIYFIENFPDDVPSEGIFLAATNFEAEVGDSNIYVMKIGIGRITNVPMPNGHLTWSYIHYMFHMHERSASDVYINGQLEVARSVRKSKQITIGFQNKCFDIDTTKRILTQIGVGETNSWSYRLDNNFLTLKVLT